MPNGEIWVSQSQIKTAEECPAKWAFDKIARVPRIQTKNQKFGSDAHGHLEHYGLTAELPPNDCEGKAALSVIARGHVPGPEISVYYEGKNRNGTTAWNCDENGMFKLPVPELPGVFFIGYIDQDDERTQMAHIKDYKFTKSLKYAVPKVMLPDDAQCQMYLNWATRAYRKPANRFELLYTEVKERKSGTVVTNHHEVHYDVQRDDPWFKKSWARLVGTATRIRDWNQHKRANEKPTLETIKIANTFEKNPDACDMYGGCIHRRSGMCTGRKGNSIRNLLKQAEPKKGSDMSSELLARIRAKQKAKDQAPPEPAEVTEETEVAAADEKQRDAKKAALHERLAKINNTKKTNQRNPTEQEGAPPAKPVLHPGPYTGDESIDAALDADAAKKAKEKPKRKTKRKAKAKAKPKEGAPVRKNRAEGPYVYVDHFNLISTLAAHSANAYGTRNFEEAFSHIFLPDGQPWDTPVDGFHFTYLKGEMRKALAEELDKPEYEGKCFVVDSGGAVWSVVSDIVTAKCAIIR